MADSPDRLLAAVESMIDALETEPVLPLTEARRLIGDDDALFMRCLAFLRDRDLVLFVAGDERLFHRPTLADDVLSLLRRSGSLHLAEISRLTALPSAITAQIAGWLECEGMVTCHHDDGGVTVKAR